MFGKNVGALVENHIDGFLNYLAETESIDISKLYERYKEFENIPTDEMVISKKPKRAVNKKKKEKKEEKNSNGYSKMKLPELKSLCKAKGIKATVKWRKADYVKALEDFDTFENENRQDENANRQDENENENENREDDNESLQSNDDNESMQNDLEELEQTFTTNHENENFGNEQNNEIVENLMTSSANVNDLGLDSSDDDEIDPSKEVAMMKKMFEKNPPENIYDMSIDELRKLCNEKGIKPKKRTKRAYITALEESDNNDDFGDNLVNDDEIF